MHHESFPHRTIHTHPARPNEQDGKKSSEIKISLLVNHAINHPYMCLIGPEFGYAHVDDQHQGGKPGEEPQGQQQAAKKLGEDHQRQADAVAEVKGVGENVLQMAEILELFDAIKEAEDEAKSHAQGQDGNIECPLGIRGREEFFHVDFRILIMKIVYGRDL